MTTIEERETKHRDKIRELETSTFKCVSGCKADCCGIIPIPKRVYKKHRQDIQKPVDKIFDMKSEVLIITRDGFCVFLDSIGKCEIYKDRPKVCRLYGTAPNLPCPYVRNDGVVRPEGEMMVVQEAINKTVGAVISKIIEAKT